MEKMYRSHWLWSIVIAILLAVVAQEFSKNATPVKVISYSEFENFLQNKIISEVVLTEKEIEGPGVEVTSGKKYLYRAHRVDPTIAQNLKSFGVKFSFREQSTFYSNLFSWAFPIFLFFIFWSYLFRRVSGGVEGKMMSVGKSKAKIYVETDTKVTFQDVAGVDEAESELKEIVDFLKDPKKYERLGGRMPKGILLVGPPGTGKTLIAKAVAGEAGVPFFSTNGAEFVEMFVGVGAARVRDLFEQAKGKAPCIIFIDELDALGKARMMSGIHGNDEKEQTLNQLLAELDGFDSRSGIILLAATNRPEILDPALLRSGRFDRQVLVDRPDKKGRRDILALHVKKNKIAPGIDLDKLAALTPGLTGADLANLVNEAALVAVRRNAEEISENDFTQALERMLAGLEKKNRLINAFERRVVAYHEMGHAIVALYLSKVSTQMESIHKISIIPRGIGTLGYTIQRPTEDRFLMTKAELENKMAVLLAGRASEKLIFNHLSTGAVDDLDKATEIAWSAITRFGMGEKLGDVAYEKAPHSFLGQENAPGAPYYRSRNYSDQTAREIDQEVREMVQKASDNAYDILSSQKNLLEEYALMLLEKEVLVEPEIKSISEKMMSTALK